MSKTDLVVFGSGGFGREVMWMIETNPELTEKYNILGYVDDSTEKKGCEINGRVVVGNTDTLLSAESETAVVIAVGDPDLRKSIYEKLKINNNLFFPTVISADARVSDYVKMGQGSIICCNTIITVNIEIGDFFISNLDCTVGHDAVIGNFVTLNPSVNVSGNVTVKDGTDIGTGTNIIQGKTIGSDVIIGAGSVVVKDIPDSCTAVGVPAVPIKFHN